MKKQYNSLKRFIEEQLFQAKILIVGDVMLDKYYFGEVKRISAEAPVPITRVTKEKETLGGAANVAHNLALLGCQVYLAGVTGEDENRKHLLRLLDARQINSEGLKIKAGPTTAKMRVIGGHQQMLRLDFEETLPLSSDNEKQLKEYIYEVLNEQRVNSVIISDYAKGVCTPSLCQYIMQEAEKLSIPVIVDPKGSDWQKYRGASFITPNLKELDEAVQGNLDNQDEQVKQAAQKVRRKYHIQNVVATRSEKGLSLVGARKTVHIPTQAQEVFDVSGAGDTVIAVLAAAIGNGLAPAEAAFLANLAAGVVVGKVGTYAISRQELIAALESVREEVRG